MIPNPYLIIGLMVAALAIGAGGYAKGRIDGAAKCETRITKMKDDSQTRKDNEAAKANTAATDFEKDEAHAKVIYRDREKIVTKIVDRPVYRSQCFDADGVSVANSALAGTRAAPPQPDQPMPRSDAP
jgi:hypothetical protein